MATCLVTGAAGFIGSHVAEHLLAQGHRVIALDDLSGGVLDNVPAGCHFVDGSILDRDVIGRIFTDEGIDYVFHLAAYAAEGLSHFIRNYNYANNVVGAVNLINAAVNHDCKCFVFTSSIAVYGSNQLPMTEDLAPLPEDPYGVAKYAVELDLAAARRMFGLHYIIFRPHNVFGERQNLNDPYRNVIGIFMRQIMQGKAMTIFGDGSQTRAFSYIDDVAPLIADSINVPGAYNEIFNVGASEPRSVRDLARIVADALGVAPDINCLEAREEVLHAYSQHEKSERIFNRKSQYSLEQGIARMAAWAKSQTLGESLRFTGIEIEKNMPPSWQRLFDKPP